MPSALMIVISFDCHRLSVRMGKNKRQNDKDEQDQKDLSVISGV